MYKNVKWQRYWGWVATVGWGLNVKTAERKVDSLSHRLRELALHTSYIF